jgi:hypothetical protein
MAHLEVMMGFHAGNFCCLKLLSAGRRLDVVVSLPIAMGPSSVSFSLAKM